MKAFWLGHTTSWMVLGLEVRLADGPSFEARVELIVPLLEVLRVQFGEVIQVKYNP